jgi:hypothetical protein
MFSGGMVTFRGAKFSGGKVDFSDVGDWSCPPIVPPDVKLLRNEGQSQVSPGDL